MRRGFKAWCEKTSAEYRNTLGISLADRFEPSGLADQLGVLVMALDDLPGLSAQAITQLTVTDADSWSALTIKVGSKRVSIVNPVHPATRQRNSLTHELCHDILNHNPAEVHMTDAGHVLISTFDKEQEDKANWLAGTLLVPRDGLKQAYFQNPDEAQIARTFGVSRDLLSWRLRMTGVLAQARRYNRRNRKTG